MGYQERVIAELQYGMLVGKVLIIYAYRILFELLATTIFASLFVKYALS